MRPSQSSHSAMPTGHKWSGWWGNFGGPEQRGVREYVLSPHQQNPMKGALQGWLFHGYKRIMVQAPYFAVPIALGYGIYSWGNSKYHYLESKEGHRLHGASEE